VAKYVVAPVHSFPAGSQRRVEISGRGVAVFNIDGEFRALRDVCPHQGAELSSGAVVCAVTADSPGGYEIDLARTLVRCPWHGWEFDLATGQSWCDPKRQRTKPYPVSVEPGEALVMGEDRVAVPGPYVAETVTISVENDYVVVEFDERKE
jgi:nitrite reductase/ring-hydroxylating ferredoxin subunit